MSRLTELYVEPLPHDLVAQAQCMAIDADAFPPHPSVQFGLAVRDPASRVWVAREALGAPVAGFLAGVRRPQTLHVVGLAVHRDYRRAGVGRALMREAAARSRETGAREISLEVSTLNAAALALYHAEGYVVRSTRRGYYRFGVYAAGEDAFEMVLPLG